MKRFFLLLFSLISLTFSEGQSQISFEKAPRGKLLVFVFLSTDCPISQNYISELNRIAEKYSSEIVLKGIIPGKIKKKDLEFFKTEYQVKFKLAADRNYKMVDKLNGKTTPEVFLYNSLGLLKYEGAIDNWYYELGKHRQEPSQQYLIEAIEDLMNGKDPRQPRTQAVGCIIQRH